MANTTVAQTSAKNVITAIVYPFRAIAKAERFIVLTVPTAVFRATGLQTVVSGLLERTGLRNIVVTEGAIPAAQAAAGAEAMTNTWSDFFGQFFEAGSSKSYWGMLHYLTSRWSFVCLSMALVMNRISIYGTSRNPIYLSWHKRFALRLIPIMLLLAQIHHLLRAVHCQTSPNFSLYRHGDNDIYTILDWSSDGGALHSMSRVLLLGESDAKSCSILGFERSNHDGRAKRGSFALLWPTFLRLSMSHVVESLSCSLQRAQVMTEVGISVFEHSLAFSEAETQIAYTLSKQAAKVASATNTSAFTDGPEDSVRASGTVLAITDAVQALTGPHPFDRFNVPIEVLLIALLSCANALSSNIISVLGKQRDWRLINTAFWGVLYISSFLWGFATESTMIRTDGTYPRSVSALLHFPTVAIVGFLPHMLILFGIVVCAIIYVVALLFTAISLGTNSAIPKPTSLAQRFSLAHENLQASIPLKAINIKWRDDFYTALLRVGFAALTAASEAVFLNEGRQVEMRQFTWLEEERLDEIDKSRVSGSSLNSGFQIVEDKGIPGPMTDGQRSVGEWRSGYGKEQKLENQDQMLLQDGSRFIYPHPRTDGVGALQRTTRFYLVFILLRGIIFTIGGWAAYGIGTFLDRLGIVSRPLWLKRVIGDSLKQKRIQQMRQKENGRPKLELWSMSRDGRLEVPSDMNVDIESELRARVTASDSEDANSVLDQTMYDWWKRGGWYGERDDSGEYQPPQAFGDWDTTSVLTESAASVNEEAWESESDGRQTPTQQSTWSFTGLAERQSEPPEPDSVDIESIARLLDPQDTASRKEARILSAHLLSHTPMTRSRFRREHPLDKTKIFTAGYSSSLQSSQPADSQRPLGREEEAEVLERLLISRRGQRARRISQTGMVENTSSFAASGPMCVVCQMEPRTIIAWPCRCLIVCEDCRVSLAMNNFGNCVTCRRSVGGFVRLYVP